MDRELRPLKTHETSPTAHRAVGLSRIMGGMDDLLAPAGYLTARDTQRALGVTPGALRNLVYRGRLTRSGGTARHPWYAAKDVAAIAANRAERSTA